MAADKFEYYSKNMKDFYDDITEWHDANGPLTVHEWLELTWDEYKKLVEIKWT